MDTIDLLPKELLRDDTDPLLDFEVAIEEAARAVDAEPWVVQRLKHPERELTLNLPLVRDDGSVINVTAYRVQHSRESGPSIGPLIFSPAVHVAKLRSIAGEITLQSALLGLRLGGAAGAIVVDANQYSERELRHLVQEYTFSLRDNMGPLSDVLVARGNDPIRQWLEQANTRAKGVSEPAAVVAKGELRDAVAGATADLIDHVLGGSIKLGRVALQGFGTRGRSLARTLARRGAKVIAVADRSGGLFQETGIDVAELEMHVAANGVVFGFPGAAAVANADVLECDCDALVLAAGERQIGSYNGPKIRARAVIELTQGAIAPSAQLPPNSVVVPHLIAGAPEVAIWAYEWRCGLTYSELNAVQAEREASALVVRAMDRALQREEPLRNAFLTIAVERVAETLRRR